MDWKTFKKVNRLLDIAERIAGDEFRRRYVIVIESVHQGATIVIKDRGNGLDVCRVSFSFDARPAEIARMLRNAVRI